MHRPGLIAFLSSGETMNHGGQVFEYLAQHLPQPLDISILETPAGFELNSDRVAGRVADYIKVRLQNYRPEIHLIPARKRSGEYGTENLKILQPMLTSYLLYMGAGSPSYAVRQLNSTPAWDLLRARHRIGAALMMTSAATIAMGKLALPIYEMYKVGEDPHWKSGLDLLGDFGLRLAIIPHWNNNDGGAELDTSHCFIGAGRFQELLSQLPADVTVLGLDEKSAIVIDFESEECQVLGQDGIHLLLRTGEEVKYCSGDRFSICELGNYQPLANQGDGIPSNIWELANEAEHRASVHRETVPLPPSDVMSLVEKRQSAREQRNWQESDQIRDQIAAMGWQVQDTPNGPQIVPLGRS